MSTMMLGPVGVVGKVEHYSGQHPDGYRISAWAVQPFETGYKALTIPR